MLFEALNALFITSPLTGSEDPRGSSRASGRPGWGRDARHGQRVSRDAMSLSGVGIIVQGTSWCKYLKGKWKCHERLARLRWGIWQIPEASEQMGLCRRLAGGMSAGVGMGPAGVREEDRAQKKPCQGDHRKSGKSRDVQMKV